MWQWLGRSYQWIFSGIGVLIITLILHQWSKSQKKPQSKAEMNNSLLAHSTVASGSHNTQTVSTTTIHAETVNFHSAIGAPTRYDSAKTQEPQPAFNRVVVGIAVLFLVVIILALYYPNPKVLGVRKSEPLTDSRGDLLESPANETELEVIRLQDQIMDLRQYKESVQQPDSRRRLKDAPSLAKRILSFSDSSLNPRRRFIKYEYAAFAYVDAAAAAMFDDRPMVEEYASQAVSNADTALSMFAVAERSYPSDQNSRFLLDWIPKHEGEDRVLYLRADAECMLGTTKNDEALKAKALQTWNLISSSYRRALPAKGTLQLGPCVPPEKSN